MLGEIRSNHPLLESGFCELTLPELAQLTAYNDHRRALFQGLARFYGAVTRFPIVGSLWIGGSFLTTKELPADVDVVVIMTEQSVNVMTGAQQKELGAIFDPEVAAKRYGIDLYCARESDLDSTAYFSGLLGFCRDRITPAGIAKVKLIGATHGRRTMALEPTEKDRRAHCAP